jgi:N-acetylmuramoyl-L-alanine amidase
LKWYKLLIIGLVIIIAVIIYLFANISVSEEVNVVTIDLTPKFSHSQELIPNRVITLEKEEKEPTYELLYAIVWAEAGNQSIEGQAAVASVILNRIDSKYFPDDLESVVYQGNGRQFNGVWRDEFGYYTDETVQAVEQAINDRVFDKDVVYFANTEISTDLHFIQNVIIKNKVEQIGCHTFAKDERGY